ncbi:MAG: ADP-ribosylglycohydrolase family protein [Fimbriimonadaceae bacterium]|nr:ADP-ribosylglycohydrolase family protein [Fimbriimonadaceae bacterium]
MALPSDYLDRVYAGVLGKIIGVYLGRPFEGWSHERIEAELGEIWYYVHEQRGVPLVVTDDDISGTFTFVRSLEDHGLDAGLTAEQIGQTWLNYLIEKRTILWWGGLGTSTEHTAFLRLKHGIPAPRSGSIALNGRVVAEQIGAQIFIDGWGLICPGNPALAADFARRAGSVSHDGEAIYGAQVIAAMEAAAFEEADLDRLLDSGLAQIPADCVIAQMIGDLRRWRSETADWREARRRLDEAYGYHKYGGGCHMVPNHGLIILALLWGDGDFQKSLMIVNTCGWDTDCNSANVGCLLGVRGGLAAIDAGPDWRGPVADRLFLPTADGGRCITDALREAVYLANLGRSLAGEPPLEPKRGARFHFAAPGAVQGFQPEDSPAGRGTVKVVNKLVEGRPLLALKVRGLAPGRPARVATATFVPPSAMKMAGYGVLASPTLYPGQTVTAAIAAPASNPQPLTVGLQLRHYETGDRLAICRATPVELLPGASVELAWRVPDLGGRPIAEIGLEMASTVPASGTVLLDWLTWSGTPEVTLRPVADCPAATAAWINGLDHSGELPRLVQNEGLGLLLQGTREWTDYRASTTITPHLCGCCGLAVRAQGMRRWYALLLDPTAGEVRLEKCLHDRHVLARQPLELPYDQPYQLTLEVSGNRLRGTVNGDTVLCASELLPLTGGAVAVILEEGRAAADAVRVEPL